MNGDEQLLTLEDVAERLKVSVSTVRRWVRSNELRSIKVGNRGQYRIGLKDLEEFLAEQPDTTAVTALKRGREWKEAIDWARNHTKYIVVTGGVISGLGKGIAAASIGKLLNSRLSVVPIKCDGYLNTDPGTMNPIEHGEVFVLDDGGEVDMDRSATRNPDLVTFNGYANQYVENPITVKAGEPAPSGCSAEQWSCTMPGRNSSAERAPPPTVSCASRTCTSSPARASTTAAVSPLGPLPTTVARAIVSLRVRIVWFARVSGS